MMSSINKKLISFLLGVILLSVGFVAYADWKEPTGTVPGDINLPAALNISAIDQAKLGGLELNKIGQQVGLFVFGNNNNGFVGIGTNAPTEKLDVVGNIRMGGSVFVNGKPGQARELLTRTPEQSGEPKMDWKPRRAWMTIQRLDIVSKSGCTQIFGQCPAGWTESEVITKSNRCVHLRYKIGPPLGYGGQTRVCYKDL